MNDTLFLLWHWSGRKVAIFQRDLLTDNGGHFKLGFHYYWQLICTLKFFVGKYSTYQ
jgi:hypothetical protein